MLIVSKVDDVDNKYMVWNTVTDDFLCFMTGYNQTIGALMDYRNGYSYEDAKGRVDRPQPFSDIEKAMGILD